MTTLWGWTGKFVLPQDDRMPRRDLFIAAYDVANPRRLRRMLAILKEYAVGGQRSVFECFLTEAERNELMNRVQGEVDEREDKFILIRLDPRREMIFLGKAVAPENPPYFVVG